MENSIKENLQIKNKKFKKVILAGALVVSMITSAVTNQNVDAKKKNTKPKLILKGLLKNKNLCKAEGQTLKLNFKAKDKEDGNLTKKVKISVKKPAGGKVKINKKKRQIKFIKAGKYKIVLSVKDSKNKKVKKTIPIEILDLSSNSKNQYIPTISTPAPTVTSNNENINIKQMEVPAITGSVVPEPERYQNYEVEKVEMNGNEYKTVSFDSEMNKNKNLSNKTVDFYYSGVETIAFDGKYFDEFYKNKEYLKYLGKITAIDKYGNDVSNSVVIGTMPNKYGTYVLSICAEDTDGNVNKVDYTIGACDDINETYNNYLKGEGAVLVNENPKVYVIYKKNVNYLRSEDTKVKTLKY